MHPRMGIAAQRPSDLNRRPRLELGVPESVCNPDPYISDQRSPFYLNEIIAPPSDSRSTTTVGRGQIDTQI
jgi:hypothetical protein